MDTPLELPERLRGVFFDRRWETSKVWRLPTPTQTLCIEELDWLLDLTVWTSIRGEVRWDLSPRMVLESPPRYPRHWAKISNADLAFPLEMFRCANRWVIVDGFHRLARHQINRMADIPVRLHPDECWEGVQPDRVGKTGTLPPL